MLDNRAARWESFGALVDCEVASRNLDSEASPEDVWFLRTILCETRSFEIGGASSLSWYCDQLSSWASPMRSPSGPRM